MAHADYNCCAVCDCKMEYNSFDSRTKEDICTDCLKALRKHGLNILDVNELIEWMKSEKPKKIKQILESVGFETCCYDNGVDKIYNSL